ncbi:hypothetical protein BJX63DRAFT_432947 [Aspergillus granulosus]|uniref:FAD dependent oxidoreductase domain-containing protein n=1 Tax=Aspergillus granulosus TaxID=176169 RepID=A0ABR4H909_9EURO
MSPIPVSSSTTPFWRTELHEFDSHRITPDLPSNCDIVIFGAGFVGAALVYYLYDENPSPPAVIILEAREACSGATGRNGQFAVHGHMKPDVYYQDLVEKEKVDCDFVLTRDRDATLDPKLARDTHYAFIELQKSGIADLKDVFYAHGKEADQLTKSSGVKGALPCFTFTAGHVWPYKMVMHLLQTAVTGANLQTHTPVTRISDTPLPDGRWLAHTERGTIKAKKILIATNGYTAYLGPQFQDKIVAVRGICSRNSPPDFMPYVGEVPGKPNPMILAGFSGYGMAMILLSAKVMGQMIRHGLKF